jgi:lipopolysaccharide assembly outer membrane protein LptD (OstA)
VTANGARKSGITQYDGRRRRASMKLNLTFALAAGFLGGVFLSYAPGLVHAQSPTRAEPKLQLVDTFTSRGQVVIMAADNIDRDVSMIRLRGNVEIKLRPSGPNVDVMVLRADEAVYHKQGDEIVPRGSVRVTLERPK